MHPKPPPDATHVAFGEQPTPHAPQFAASERSVSQPVGALVSQSSRPVEQVSIAHEAIAQTELAKGSEQTLPQLPQFVASTRRSTQAPPQQVWPSAQMAPPPHEHTPVAQESTRVP